MGYECKLYFKDLFDITILSIDLCKMGYDFPHGNFYELFNKEYQQGLYADLAGARLSEKDKEEYGCEYIPDVEIYEDRYGSELKYCDINELYKWCKANRKEMCYRRLDLLYKIVKELRKEDKWGDIKVVFYGY